MCSCLAGMLGTPPYCRPECLIHADCPTKLACLNNKCRDPCIGSCGFNAQCTVVNHQPICSCHEGFQGDPFSGCGPVPAGKLISSKWCTVSSRLLSNSISRIPNRNYLFQSYLPRYLNHVHPRPAAQTPYVKNLITPPRVLVIPDISAILIQAVGRNASKIPTAPGIWHV